MSCQITTGRKAGSCYDSVGGIRNIHFINHFSSLENRFTYTGDKITAVSSSTPAYTWELTGPQSFTETNVQDVKAATSVFDFAGTVQVAGHSDSDITALNGLSKGKFAVVIETNAGEFRIFGSEFGAYVAVNTTSGADYGDFKGYTLNITGRSTSLAPFVATSLLTRDYVDGSSALG